MNKKVSTYILAEMASSHEGDPKIAEFIINAAARAKADGIILQLFNLDTYIIPSDDDYQQMKRIYLNQDIWSRLIEKSNSLGLDVWANVYDNNVRIIITQDGKASKRVADLIIWMVEE